MQIAANVNYHVHSPDPQAYLIDAGGVTGKLVPPVQDRQTVSVRDLRGQEDRVRFDRDSLAFVKRPSVEAIYGNDNAWQKAYDRQLVELLTEEIGAQDVVIFDHTVRIDDPTSDRKPARNVHSDYSEAGAQQRLKDLLGDAGAADWREGHFGFVNVWRPIRHPIASAPLGFVLPGSVEDADWVTLDLVYPDRVGQIMGLVHQGTHDWVYLSAMTPDEVAIFNIYDNRGLASIAHSALDLDTDRDASVPRMSLENRTLVRYAR